MANRLPQGRTLRDKDNEPNAIEYYALREREKKNNPIYRQMEALALDSFIAALPYGISVLYLRISQSTESPGKAFILIHDNKPLLAVFLAVFSILFIFKDIFGRSIGQRIYKLHIVSTDGAGDIPKWKLIVRNLLFFVIPLDLLILLFTGKRLIDRMLRIDVVPYKQ